MIRQLINIGNMPYIVDLYDAYSDNIYHYEQFVMFRNYEIVNDLFMDKELYFVDKSIWDDDEQRVNLIWPICAELGAGFSYDYKYYNGLFSDTGLNKGYDTNIIYNKYKNVANVRCNVVRIYRPTMRSTNNMIIHVDNFINNIHIHYLCKLYNDCPIHSSEEIILNNITYSEYIEFYFPNVYDLFDNDKLNDHIGCYFKETLNIVDCSNIKTDMLFIDDEDNRVYFPLDILSLPSTIEPRPYEITDKDGKVYTGINYIKKYTSVSRSIENNYLTYPVNIILWPYETVLINNKFVRDDSLNIGSSTFMTRLDFTLSAKMGFADNHVSIITEFNYPNKEAYERKHNGDTAKALQDAYLRYNNVREEHYKDFKLESIEKYKEELERTALNEDDIIIVKKYYAQHGEIITDMDYKDLHDKYVAMKLQSLYEELNEDANTALDFLGFRIVISSDINFTHIIYDNNVKIQISDLDNFAFHLNDIIKDWTSVYDGYYNIRVIFIDRLLGTEIMSNSVVIGPEWIKFIINSTNERIISFNNKDNETDNMDYNFIENIRCVVHRDAEESDKSLVRGNNSPRMLYRPIFYRASSLQNVKIRRNVKQKIGINLSEFMTKVETFKMLLNGIEYIEYGRNEAFVIFEVSGNNFNTANGMYDILNQDDEYISSGNYSLI